MTKAVWPKPTVGKPLGQTRIIWSTVDDNKLMRLQRATSYITYEAKKTARVTVS